MLGPVSDEIVRLRSFPRYRVIGRELFACRASEIDLWEALGAPTSEINPPLGQGSPQMFWDVEFPCGLVMGLQLDCISERLIGFLDAPEVSHAIRHLGIRPADLWLLETADPAKFAAVAPPVPHDARLWEQEGSSEPELLGSHLARRDAQCQLAELDGIEPGVRLFIDHDATPAAPPALAARPVASEPDDPGLLDELFDDDDDPEPSSPPPELARRRATP